MAQRRKGRRALGPYKHGQRWRILIRDDGGKTHYEPYDSQEEAEEVMRSLAREFDGVVPIRVEEAIEQYKTYLKVEKQNKAGSISTTVNRLQSFFPSQRMFVRSLSPKTCLGYYEALQRNSETDTHRNTLAEVKTFLKWCVREKHLRQNPAAQIAGTGKRKKGKEQLRPDEARAFMERALEEAAAGNDGSFAAASALLLGLRQNAISRRLVRDVDVLGRKLFIVGDKTAAGTRSVVIPDVLWPHFESRIADRDPMEALLPASSKDGFHLKEWVNKNTRRICEALGIPVVCAQALRGTHSTLAEESGVSGEAVARQLGHESITTTRAHYTKPEAVQSAQQRRALTVLAGGKK